MILSEQRMFELKQLCNKKWRTENPKGYFGQMRHASTRAASEWMCKLAGFKTLEEADAYFKHQNKAAQEAMIKEANVLQKGQPAWTAEQQTYVRSQVQSGLEGAEVQRDVPSLGGAVLLVVVGIIVAAWMLLRGKKK